MRNYFSTAVLSCTIVFVISFISIARAQDAEPFPTPNVPWNNEATFEYDTKVSDEFNGNSLNLDIWDEHGIRNFDTNCPTWNGPPSTVADPTYSTFFPATDHPKRPNKRVREYRFDNGSIQLRINNKKTNFFKKREYYCDPNTFTCNHDSSIPCYWTNFFGEPVYTDSTNTTYAGIVHDKCKKSPFCIPHFNKVENNAQRTYSKYTSTHLTGKNLFRYGYIETRVKLADASNILAVWMHGRNSTGPGFCRYRRAEGFLAGVRRECPSFIRSERWQEIDLVEAMNSDIHQKRYIPNIHVFAGHKGEYTSSDAVDDGSGRMGGGPIVVNKGLFNQYSMFSDLTDEQREDNEFHWNPGTITNFTETWAQAWHVLGCYWSRNEIRFYVDGVEIIRIDNVLVHQPMALDVSASLNVGWSEQIPDDSRIKQWGSVDYVRVWAVNTPTGEDPPTELPLLDPMGRKWEDLYGSDMYGVYDRFPHNDQVTLLPVSEVETGARSPASFPGEVRSELNEDVDAKYAALAELANQNGRLVSWRRGDGAANNARQITQYRNSSAAFDGAVAVRQGRRRGLPAGGAPHQVGPMPKRFTSEFMKGVQYSFFERVGVIKKRRNGKNKALKIEDGTTTAGEMHSPNEFGSGFSFPRGEGRE